MSTRSLEVVTCPKCGHETEAELWGSVCIRLDPHVKDLLFKSELNRVRCAGCGLESQVEMPFLYSDTDLHYMVFYIQEGIPPSLIEMPDFITKLPQFNEVQQKLRQRVVRSMRDLAEKVLIFDAGLDDRVVECVKHMFTAIPGPERKCSDSLFFSALLPNNQMAFLDAKAEDKYVLPPPETYSFIEDILQATGELEPASEYLEVDRQYAKERMKVLDSISAKTSSRKGWLSSLFSRKGR